MEQCGHFHIRNDLPQEKETLELSERQRRFGLLGKLKNMFQVSRIEPRFVGFLDSIVVSQNGNGMLGLSIIFLQEDCEGTNFLYTLVYPVINFLFLVD
jgi:hypothetical protein